jgi:hypothetical protein
VAHRLGLHREGVQVLLAEQVGPKPTSLDASGSAMTSSSNFMVDRTVRSPPAAGTPRTGPP